ncbi:MAG: CAP-associated domain-containing protein [Terrisporobacter sp.]
MKKFLSVFLVILLIFCYNTNFFQEIKEIIEIKVLNENENYKMKDREKTIKVEEIDYFENIKIGDTKESVIEKLKEPVRIDNSEYNFKWYIYKNNKEKFIMIGIENKKVVALFSNNINSCESEGIDINKDINYIRENYSTLSYKTKGNVKYKITSNDEYHIIYKNRKYITAFYDKHDDNRIWAYLIIDKNSEDEVNDIYPKDKENLIKSYELEIIDLTNCTRYSNNLSPLQYSEKAKISATNHSLDMSDNNYFDHNNLKNETPFDRMEKQNINYTTAGENIAAGQTNAIFAHNGWINSLGHRKNILGNYTYIGVGVIFGGYYKTYYTENFFG